MSNSARKFSSDRVPSLSVQIPLPLLDVLGSAESAFLSLCVATGREVLTAMMEQERIQPLRPQGQVAR